MAHFYGTIEGKGGTKASRCGSKASGLEVHAMAWGGAVHVEFQHLDDGTDWVRIEGRPHPDDDGFGGRTRVLYEGPVKGLWQERGPGLGLIEVRVGPSDARERLAYLTPKGRRVVQSLAHFMEA